MIPRCSGRCYHDYGHAGPCADAPTPAVPTSTVSAPLRLRLSFDVALREDISAAEWTMTLGQALETLRPALAKGSVPVVTATRTPESRDEIRSQLRTQLDEAEASANAKIATIGGILRGDVEVADLLVERPSMTDAEHEALVAAVAAAIARNPTCRCGHTHDRHDRIAEGEQRRGACAAWGCRCGLWRPADRVANANGGAR